MKNISDTVHAATCIISVKIPLFDEDFTTIMDSMIGDSFCVNINFIVFTIQLRVLEIMILTVTTD